MIDEEKNPVASASLSYDSELSPDFEHDQHVCHVHISVAPGWRRKKIAAHFLDHLIETARCMDKDTVMAEVDNPMGLRFCRHLRGELLHEEVQYRLYMEDVDWRLVERWIEDGKKKSPYTQIEFFQECPENDIEEFCRVYTEVINQRPTGDMEQALITTPESRRIEEQSLKKRGIEWHTMISRERVGQISGLTDIMHNPKEPHRVNQYLTGILAGYRRKGLAKRLKAEMMGLIPRFWGDTRAQGLVPAARRYGLTSLYLTAFGQAALVRCWQVAGQALGRALRHSAHPRALVAWGRFFRAGLLYLFQK